MSATAAIIGGAFGLGATALNNILAGNRTAEDRYGNYELNEAAAEAADRRTRALYADFYSPEALLKQYKAAGLSPSMMFGGTPGQGGMSGAQGAGANGLQTPFVPYSIVDAAQAAALTAQAEKTKAETKQIEPLAQADIASKLAEAGHAKAAAAAATAEAEGQKLQNYITEHTTDASIYTICELADKAAHETAKAYHEMRSAKVLADVDEETYKEQVETKIATLRNIISATAKNNKDIEQVTQEMKHKIYTWDLEWRQLDVQEKQQTTYEEWINAQIPKIEKELEIKAEELGIEKKRLWIDAVLNTLKDIAIGAAAASQFKGSNATPPNAKDVLKPKRQGGHAYNRYEVPHYKKNNYYAY